MTRNEANVYLALILETIAELGGNGAPSGPMYAALMGRISLEDYESLIGICTATGLVTKSRDYVLTITPKGRDVVAAIATHRAKVSA